MTDRLDDLITQAMTAATAVSIEAKNSGDMPVYYAANRAWNTLYAARSDLERRRRTLVSSPGEKENG